MDRHPDGTRYFLITGNKANFAKSLQVGMWATPGPNTLAFDCAYDTAPAVILIFSIKNSAAYQGYALMRSAVGKARPWKRPVEDPFNNFGPLFEVEWKSVLRLDSALSFNRQEISTITNAFANHQPLTWGLDGQEIPELCGRRLCYLMQCQENEGNHPGTSGRKMPQSPGGGVPSGKPRSMKGTLIKYFTDKGFGFVSPNDGSGDIFVHVKENPELEGCTGGESVEFDPEYDDFKRKYKGMRVKITGGGGGAVGGGKGQKQDKGGKGGRYGKGDRHW